MDKEPELTLLNSLQVLGENEQLKTIKKYGVRAKATDFAIATGALVDRDHCFDSKLDSEYWLRDTRINNKNFVVDMLGYIGIVDSQERSSIRPVLNMSDFFTRKVYNDDIYRATYGEYPQFAPDEKFQKELQLAYSKKELKLTGRAFYYNSLPMKDGEGFKPESCFEYEYKRKKYIRIRVNSQYDEITLSNQEKYKCGEEVWIEVLPVVWLLDYDTKTIISEYVLISGIGFFNENNHIKDFRKSDIKYFLDNYMLPDILDKPKKVNDLKKAVEVKEINPYGLKFDKVSEEEIIRGAIESGVAVFLHGPSSEGKSARVKQIDPDCKIIYLRNASPDSLNGKSVYNSETGEMIDVKPSWLKQLEEKCESEPDKLHVVFFDEITNALPSIQGIAFNIVLDREVNGIWKLPENARIVASGNEMKDSLASNQLAEPLFNRFAHVYIKTTVESWLKWASENGIHPAIYTFVAYKRGEVLRSEYNGERPNADPRKWEMASKMLYATSNPEMIRSLVGEEITNEFVAFCKTKVITVEDVINDNYEKEDLRSLNTSERYATVMCLSQVTEEHIEKVRNFVSLLGEEYRSIFDTLWIQNKPERLETIAELNQGIPAIEDESNTKNSKTIVIDEINDIELTLLSEEEIWGDNQLEAIKKYGTVAPITDFVILTDGYHKDYNFGFYEQIHKTGWFYTKTADGDGDIVTVNEIGKREINYRFYTDGSIRPVIKDTDLISELYPSRTFGNHGVEIVSLGEYPQYAASKELQKKLENEYISNSLLTTGRHYDIVNLGKTMVYHEFEYNGKKYIRVKVQSFYDNGSILSNGMTVQNGEYVWVEVSPVEWLIDIQTGTLISKSGLVTGVKFQKDIEEYYGDFEKTGMYRFLNEYLVKDLFQSYKKKKDKQLILKR